MLLHLSVAEKGIRVIVDMNPFEATDIFCNRGCAVVNKINGQRKE